MLRQTTQDLYRRQKAKETYIENPFLLAIFIFGFAFFINYLLELDVSKSFFEWVGYFLNSFLYSTNTVIQSAIKNHPYIAIPVFENPITPDVIEKLSPWMWLRGYLVGAFAAGVMVTILQIKRIESKNMLLASVFIVIAIIFSYCYPNLKTFSVEFFTSLIQKIYFDLILAMLVSVQGLFMGSEYSVYLLRHNQVEVLKNKDGANLNIKLVRESDFDFY